MKKILFTAAMLSLLIACNNKDKEESARQATLDSVNMANNHQRMLDSMTAISSSSQDAVVIESPTLQPAAPEPETKKKSTSPKKTSNPTTSKEPSAPAPAPSATTAPAPESTAGTSTASGAGDGTVAAEEKKKKGLNNAAKGAIIGLGTGAAAGAVINKDNRGKGAVIGGVIGAVGGAVGGAVLDKRKAKKEAAAKDSTEQK